MDIESIKDCLKELGLDEKMINQYLEYEDQKLYKQQLNLINAYRRSLLDNIHKYQNKLDCLDYIRFILNKRNIK